MDNKIELNVTGDLNIFGLPEAGGYVYVDILSLPDRVAEYVRLIELEETNRICKCEWIVHPDDVDKPEGGRRIRKGEPHLACPVHTKEGFLIGFFRWLLVTGKPAINVTGLGRIEKEFVDAYPKKEINAE